MTRPLLLIASVALLAIGASALEKPPQGPPQSGTVAGDQGKPAAPEEETPVPVPPPSDKALSYYRSGNVLWVVDLVWGLLIPALFLFTGFSARIRTWAQKLGRKWFFVIGIYFVIFLILNFIIDLPLSYYEGFVREHAYGLSNQTLAKWLGDALKSLAVGIVGGFLFLWVPYMLLKKSPRRWWLYTALLTVPFMMFVMLIAPIWIDPLFNDFGPMKDKALESKILALAERAGVEGSRVYEVNKSVDTSAVDAYVTGFLQTKRIVLWDTILAKLNDKELLVVVGHEMGHYVLHHIITGIIFSFFLILIALYLAYKLANGLIARYKRRFGFEQLSDVASLPLLLLLVGIFSFVISPISLAFSRYQEHEADRFALEITRDNHDAATAFIKLQQENLAVPRPGLLYKLWRSSHPPVGERIDFCNEYHPWRSGQPLKYADRFKDNP
jgi:Zn-dependent protease with chaperone function